MGRYGDGDGHGLIPIIRNTRANSGQKSYMIKGFESCNSIARISILFSLPSFPILFSSWVLPTIQKTFTAQQYLQSASFTQAYLQRSSVHSRFSFYSILFRRTRLFVFIHFCFTFSEKGTYGWSQIRKCMYVLVSNCCLISSHLIAKAFICIFADLRHLMGIHA